ncbi:MAG: peptidase C45 acyl-coenzyme A:6-aminopenicillanic acid acyl-transferase [Planctomycetes bacterium]|nr:peptidase C45 acyl-coenzyme A:6-aminopenicillanic acid acyl-transferase [Planctomycetota bacterium]
MNSSLSRWARTTVAVLIALLLSSTTRAQQNRTQPLYDAIDQILVPFQTRTEEPVTLAIKATYKDRKGRDKTAEVTFRRVSPSAFALSVSHPKARFLLVRSDEHVFLHIPDKGLMLVGEGDAPTVPDQAFTLSNIVADLRTRSRSLSAWVDTLSMSKSVILAPIAMATGYAIIPGNETDAQAEYSIAKGDKKLASLVVDKTTRTLSKVEFKIGRTPCVATISLKWEAQLPPMPTVEKTLPVKRAELELALLKGAGRALEILAEDRFWRPPMDTVKIGEHGKYRVKNGQRIVYLEGGPYDIGFQHGKFLADETRKLIESTLYVVGMVYTMEKGSWFLNDIRAAAARLEPHIPKDFLEEMKGLAAGSGIDYDRVRLANCFPALFHCSGFAVRGKATVDGKLYHGRVLDYMTRIGLQYNAALFVVRKKGKIPFVNVGYAGFIGSVTGMNEKKVALGEMGGGGDGKWDGVPMATLMRMALEDAGTLDDAKRIFSENPRTCEYYYVFSDGKDRSAVGVKAVPERIEFVAPGETHPQLPTPIEDCVLLSSGKRYEALCRLVQESYGKIGPEQAMKFMGLPVAMGKSNLHDVLFCPETLELWVANAGRKKAAYQEPFHHYSLPELLSDEFYPIPKAAAKK